MKELIDLIALPLIIFLSSYLFIILSCLVLSCLVFIVVVVHPSILYLGGRDCMELHGTAWNCMELHGTAWNRQKERCIGNRLD